MKLINIVSVSLLLLVAIFMSPSVVAKHAAIRGESSTTGKRRARRRMMMDDGEKDGSLNGGMGSMGMGSSPATNVGANLPSPTVQIVTNLPLPTPSPSGRR